jgi:predicted DNA-binding transcriptional regulator AlpA
MRFYSMEEVCLMFGVSRTTIARWEKENGFPLRAYLGSAKPTRLADGRTKRSNCRIGFPDVEVDSWAQARLDERTPPSDEEDDTSDGK